MDFRPADQALRGPWSAPATTGSISGQDDNDGLPPHADLTVGSCQTL